MECGRVCGGSYPPVVQHCCTDYITIEKFNNLANLIYIIIFVFKKNIVTIYMIYNYKYNHLHVRYESVEISQLSVLFLISTNEE